MKIASLRLLPGLVGFLFLINSSPTFSQPAAKSLFTPASPVAFNVTLEAENMPTKTAGDASPPGWVLWDNGYIAQTLSFSSSGSYQLTLRAQGNLVAGAWPQAEIRLDQIPQTVITVNHATYTEFAFHLAISAGSHQIAIAFINDYWDAPDDRNLWVDWLRIQSTQPLLISNVAAGKITSSLATITWTTNEAGDTQVEYGLTTSYGLSTPLEATLVTTHVVMLSGLQANTTYHYRVKSKDAARNLTVSTDTVFATSAPGNVAFDNVQEIFDNNCVRCHQGVTPPAGLSLVSGQAYNNLVKVPSTEYPAWQRVQPNNRAVSWLYEKINNPTPRAGSKMANLTPAEIALIGTWIDQGATAVPAAPYADLEFRTTTVPNAETKIAYSADLAVWGGLPPYQFDIAAGKLPPGLYLDSSSGMVAGTPARTGLYNFTIRVSDSRIPATTLEQNYAIDVRNTQASWQVPGGFTITPVVTNLHLPVNIAFVPNPGPNPADPYFYVTLLYGDIIMVQRNFKTQVYATGLLNFEPTASFPGSGEMGVIGITVEPVSGEVFASMVYEESPGSGTMRNKVVRFHSADGGHTAATQTTILSGIPAGVSHQIQALTMGPDGKLYVNIGDGLYAEAAPDLNDLRGKILRMNLDGSIPADNPFPHSLVYATGVRNPFGADWRAADGKLYISDNGPDIDDRLVPILAGRDYGWRVIAPDLTKGAIHLWNPPVAPVAIDFMENAAFPSIYSGQLFVGSSGDPYLQGASRGKKIERFALDANGKVVSRSLFLDYIGAGKATVVGLAFGPDGLYFTDLFGENGFDQFGQVQGNVYRIKWMAGDSIAPVIGNVQVSIVTAKSATLTWQTNEPATRQVEYGIGANYGKWTALQTDLQTSHAVTLTQLTPETTYHFRGWNWDAAINSAVSSDFAFITATLDTIAPVISNVQTDSLGARSVLVVWNTNEPATSVVEYDTSATYQRVVSDLKLVTAHRIWLAGLADSARYNFRVRSADASGNVSLSNHGAFVTLLEAAPPFNLTLEAENMPIHTSGAARYSGWMFWENGYIAEKVAFPNTGAYQFTLQASGNFAAGDWPQAEIRLDQTVKATITINSASDAAFASTITVTAGAHEVAIAFINDIYEPPDDRNLAVDWLRIEKTNLPAPVKTAIATKASSAMLPSSLALQSYPNPFNLSTRISFSLPQDAEVHLAVYDLAGREVQTFITGTRDAGNYEVIWQGRDRHQRELSSGIYLVRLRYRAAPTPVWSQLVRRVMLAK